MTTKSSFSKIVGSATIGNILEYYDFFLFIYLAPVISPLFFPAEDKLTSIITGLSVYALGYFMRPLGAIFFGYIGDTYGRKRALTTSIILMAIPTTLIGCLPTYQAIGIFSPLLLTIFRLLQGLCVGGEYNGAGIFVVENVKGGRRSLAGSLVTSSSGLGGLLGSGMAAFVFLPFMPSWAWRGAFIAGGLTAIVGLYVRLKVMENNPVTSQTQKAPFLEALRNYPRSILYTIGIASFSGMMSHLTLSYISIFLTVFRGWPLSHSLAVVSFAKILYIFTVPIVGRISDHVGERATMIMGALATIIFIYPVILLLTNAQSISMALMAAASLAILAAWFQAPMNSYMATLFPPECRYTGVAFSYSIGIAMFAGTTSVILTLLIKWTNNPLVAALYILFGACLGLLAVIKSKPVFSPSDPLSVESINASKGRSRNSILSRNTKKNILLLKTAKGLPSRKKWVAT